jgi:hypothetical protein
MSERTKTEDVHSADVPADVVELERALNTVLGESGDIVDIAKAALLFAAFDRPRVGLARYREQRRRRPAASPPAPAQMPPPRRRREAPRQARASSPLKFLSVFEVRRSW